MAKTATKEKEQTTNEVKGMRNKNKTNDFNRG